MHGSVRRSFVRGTVGPFLLALSTSLPRTPRVIEKRGFACLLNIPIKSSYCTLKMYLVMIEPTPRKEEDCVFGYHHLMKWMPESERTGSPTYINARNTYITE